MSFASVVRISSQASLKTVSQSCRAIRFNHHVVHVPYVENAGAPLTLDLNIASVQQKKAYLPQRLLWLRQSATGPVRTARGPRNWLQALMRRTDVY